MSAKITEEIKYSVFEYFRHKYSASVISDIFKKRDIQLSIWQVKRLKKKFELNKENNFEPIRTKETRGRKPAFPCVIRAD